MKRIIPFCVIFCILFSVCSPVVKGADNVLVEDINANKNRIFDVNVSIDSHKTVSAATFIVKFDSGKIAWRGGKTELSQSLIRYSDKGDKVKLIFLCADGIALDKSKNLFTLKFKALDYGKSKIEISTADCVSNKLKNIDDFKSSSCYVTVNSTGTNTGAIKVESVEKQEQTSAGTEVKRDVLTQKTHKSITVIDEENYGIIVAVCSAFVLCIFIITYLIKRFKDRAKNKRQKNKED